MTEEGAGWAGEEGFLGLDGLFCFATSGAHLEFSLGWPPSGMEEGRRGGLADVGEDLDDGLRIGEERDKGEGGTAGRTGQREDLVDPGQ